jgi:hypothetical protein
MKRRKYKKICPSYYTGIKLFTAFPSAINILNHDMKVYKPSLEDTSYLTPFTL